MPPVVFLSCRRPPAPVDRRVADRTVFLPHFADRWPKLKVGGRLPRSRPPDILPECHCSATGGHFAKTGPQPALVSRLCRHLRRAMISVCTAPIGHFASTIVCKNTLSPTVCDFTHISGLWAGWRVRDYPRREPKRCRTARATGSGSSAEISPPWLATSLHREEEM